MMLIRKLAVAAASLALAACGDAGSPQIEVSDSWAGATAPGQSTAAAYMTIRNSGDGGDRLIGLSSSSGKAMLHSSTVDGNGVARMRPVEGVPVPAGSTVVLQPGGTHVMISELAAPLRSGATVQLELHFEKSGDRRIDAAVRPLNEGHAMHGDSM